MISTTSDRFAVLDMGSNSVRFVVYQGRWQMPVELYNEKALCSLGKGVAETGRLNPGGITRAHTAIAGFLRVAEALSVTAIHAVATAAVRDADDGQDFLATLKANYGLDVRLLSGEEEGRLSGLGILSGIHKADGMAGDLGGGSLELVRLKDRRVHDPVSLPLGPLMLETIAPAERRTHVRRTLHEAGVDHAPTLYCIGGAWRIIARLHMRETRYSLSIVQGYTVPTAALTDYTATLTDLSSATLKRLEPVAGRRLKYLPLAAMVLEETVKVLHIQAVRFSLCGLREGIYHQVCGRVDGQTMADNDPLLDAAARFEDTHARMPHSTHLVPWLEALFPARKDPALHRLMQAAACFSDCAWQTYPDCRCDAARSILLNLPVFGLTHTERYFLMIAVAVRYGDMVRYNKTTATLMNRTLFHHAVTLGLALRLAYVLTGGVSALLSHWPLQNENGTLTLHSPSGAPRPETTDKRLQKLAQHLGRFGFC